MEVLKTSIEGCLLLKTAKFQDDRGFFLESYRQSAIENVLGRPHRFMQGNYSRSKANVLRGFHTERWDKFVFVVHGRALCVVADTRPDSETFGKTESFLLGDEPHAHNRVFLRQGLSNAFYCFTEVDYLNDVSEEFNPDHRGGVSWADPLLNVEWPTREPILSKTDANLPTLQELYPDHPVFSG
ncbi:dTDP-4-dehydrorhamnose 3,5-epimerase family protein [Jiella marina]|uniref:dTDP-4-dehydrorhamnose 3,5-epimerase family protein n=1 Tax=Jiella sp. LLJ827 TaxID=2917712 RepID=UPI002100AB59|nr:dTDP-4-dehydrorhamnose 3,5-epimerase family protein [Jiella sp. LLJ827]MCQ0988013.1 dTDP-4-dehydrorhamnose 3,5-epimerase family protein [Jiella sp. LLJ827]